jgi:hypothetical protein
MAPASAEDLEKPPARQNGTDAHGREQPDPDIPTAIEMGTAGEYRRAVASEVTVSDQIPGRRRPALRERDSRDDLVGPWANVLWAMPRRGVRRQRLGELEIDHPSAAELNFPLDQLSLSRVPIFGQIHVIGEEPPHPPSCRGEKDHRRPRREDRERPPPHDAESTSIPRRVRTGSLRRCAAFRTDRQTRSIGSRRGAKVVAASLAAVRRSLFPKTRGREPERKRV